MSRGMNNNQSGFTLLEILIAMSIFTLIGIASTGLLTTVIDSNELSASRFDKLQSLQRAMLVIERDIQQAVARPIRVQGETTEIVMQGGVFDESDADGLGFVRAGWANPQFMLPRSTLEAVAYRVQNEQLQRVSGHYLDNPIGYEPRIRILVEGVSDLNVEFYVGQSSGSSRNRELRWRESYTGSVLPQGVAIEITTEDFGTIRREFELVDQRGATGSGT